MTKTAETPIACVILAAGQGTRMKSDRPKVMHELAGRSMIAWVLETAEALKPEKIVVVTGPNDESVRKMAESHITVIQEKRRGTGDAVKAARKELEGFDGDILILYGDHPLVTTQSCRRLMAASRKDDKTGLSLFAMSPENPAAYGRIITGPDETVKNIVEFADCTDDQKKIGLCNGAAYCVRGNKLFEWLDRIGNNNAQGEYYIVDLPAIAAEDGFLCRYVLTEEEEMAGANTRAQMAHLNTCLQNRLRKSAMDNGATLIDPDTVYFSWDTKLGRDVLIEPNVFFGPGVEIAADVHIKAFSHIEDSKIETGATIGPFARLRPGTKIGENARIGNFVEIKNSMIGPGVKAGHLAYIGDADIGAETNFSCGAITVNYDGFKKHKTVIGQKAMIGSDVTLVAPITIGSGAFIAAGSTITKDIPAEALAVAREKPLVKEGWAANNRKRKAG